MPIKLFRRWMQLEAEQRRLAYHLNERVKELTVLQSAAQLLHSNSRSTEEVLQELVRVLPAGWQFPEATAARIEYGQWTAQTPGYRETSFKQTEEFSTVDGRHGRIDIVYLGPAPGAGGAVFLSEEATLLRALAQILASALDARSAEEARRENEEWLRLAINHIPSTFAIYDHQRRIRFLNARGLHLSGKSEADILGKRDEELFPESVTREYLPLLMETIATKQPQSGEVRVVIPNGPTLVAFVNFVPLLDAAGNIRQILGVTHDLTQRKQMEEALRQSEEKWRRLAETLPGAIYVCRNDPRYTVLFISETVEQLTGYPRDEFLSQRISFVDLYREDELPGIYEEVNRACEERRPFRLTYRLRHRNGEWRWVNEWGVAIYEENQIHVLQGFLTDATPEKQAEEKLLYTALHDPLTGLANRTLLMDHLSQAVHRHARREQNGFAVLFLDLDRFKVINDSLGHLAGDEVLKITAERIRSCLRPDDTPARFAGDEFVILLDDLAHVEDVIPVAERVLEAISKPIEVGGTEIFTSASIGMTICSSEQKSPEELLRDADSALQRAKESGKSRYVIFDAGLHQRAVTKLRLENELRRAIENSELVLHYQPIFDLSNSRVAGFEALIRWPHPSEGMISPGTFIPLAEESGLIIPLSSWVLAQATRQLLEWQTRFPQAGPLTMAVNLSPRQFSLTAADEVIAEVIERHGARPEDLRLEITESVLMENCDVALPLLERLTRRGYTLCLDDFGTGYSSLGYLHRFPIGVVKIDRSFVSQMVHESKEYEIVRAIVSLAARLGISVTAEGVETPEQLSSLKEMGCPFVQGFLLARPAAAEQVEKLLQSGLPAVVQDEQE